jgi:hypothetical protein
MSQELLANLMFLSTLVEGKASEWKSVALFYEMSFYCNFFNAWKMEYCSFLCVCVCVCVCVKEREREWVIKWSFTAISNIILLNLSSHYMHYMKLFPFKSIQCCLPPALTIVSHVVFHHEVSLIFCTYFLFH